MTSKLSEARLFLDLKNGLVSMRVCERYAGLLSHGDRDLDTGMRVCERYAGLSRGDRDLASMRLQNKLWDSHSPEAPVSGASLAPLSAQAFAKD